MKPYNGNLLQKIKEFKIERNAMILAHNYQREEIQQVADFVGDSLELSRKAADSTAEVIVFCGVRFMAEVAAILAPEKIVLLPDHHAGCSLADMVTAADLRQKKKEHPQAAVVAYVNSPAAVKAESDICVTSSNAVAVVNSLEAEEIIFVPDKNLGSYVAAQTGKKVILWDGYCKTHHCVTAEDVAHARKAYPQALVMVHPECRPEVVAAADVSLSTGQMFKFARETESETIIVGTETGVLPGLRQENPGKKFFPLSPQMVCPDMKLVTLIKLLLALVKMRTPVEVPAEISRPARRALERMLAVV
ncbi:MAG: quinolinate synthase NadA [Dethiobacteria bacterium]|jgi:quinolinate synthase